MSSFFLGVSYMRYATAVIAVLAAFACTESSAPTAENYSGVYVLTLVNGKDLPGVVVDNCRPKSRVGCDPYFAR